MGGYLKYSFSISHRFCIKLSLIVIYYESNICLLNLWSIRNKSICFNDFRIISFINEKCNQLCSAIWTISCACLCWIIPVFHTIWMENVIAMSMNQVTDSHLVPQTRLNTNRAVHMVELDFKIGIWLFSLFCLILFGILRGSPLLYELIGFSNVI